MSRRSNEVMLLLKEALKLELPSFTLVEGLSSGDPTLLVSENDPAAAGDEVAFLKMVQKSYSGFPTPSLASSEDGRSHSLQLVIETSAAGSNSVWSSLNLAKLMARLVEANVHIELYMSANTDIPQESEIVSGNLQGEIRADVRHPNSGN